MSFELEREEGAGEGVLRAAAEEIAKARDTLCRRMGSVDEVHDARKAIKRARSLLRLGAGGVVPGKVRRRANDGLRRAARALSPTRDRHVVARVATEMASEGAMPDGYLLCIAERLRRRLSRRHEERTRFAPVAAQLRQIRSALIDCAPHGKGFPGEGLRRTYSRGRAAMRGAAEHGGVWWFHEWRKRSKDFRYQLDFLSPLWPGVLAAVADDLHRLTDLLGRANDLELLTHTLDWMPQPEHEELFQGPTVDRLHELQAETWKEALRAGARLYSEKPGRMVKRMEACWDVTQKR